MAAPNVHEGTGVARSNIGSHRVLHDLISIYSTRGRVDKKRVQMIHTWINKYSRALSRPVEEGVMTEAQKRNAILGEAITLLATNEPIPPLEQDPYTILYYGDIDLARRWVELHGSDKDIFKPQITHIKNEVANRIKVGQIRGKAAKHPTVVELGFGGARDYPLLSKIGTYIGIDSSYAMKQLAKEKYPEGKFIHANAADLFFIEDRIITVVYAAALLHHFREPQRVLKEARRILTDNGLLFVSLREGKGKIEDEGTGLFYYCQTEQSIHSLLEKTGFRIMQAERHRTPRKIKYLDVTAEAA